MSFYFSYSKRLNLRTGFLVFCLSHFIVVRNFVCLFSFIILNFILCLTLMSDLCCPCLFFFNLPVYVCGVCMYMCTSHLGVCAHMSHVCESQRLTSRCVLYCFLLYLFLGSLSWNPELAGWLDWPGAPQGSPSLFSLPSTRAMRCSCHGVVTAPFIFMVF